jgi:hypothetical protein
LAFRYAAPIEIVDELGYGCWQIGKMWWLLTCVTCQFLQIEEVVDEGMLTENVHNDRITKSIIII